MLVTQEYVAIEDAIRDFSLVNSGYSVGVTLIENKYLMTPMVTNFGPQSGNGLALYAKDLDTIVRGLSAFTGDRSIALKGPIAALPMIYGKSRNQQNVTAQFIKGKIDNLTNNIKFLGVKARAKFERSQLDKSGSPNAPLTDTRKFADKIGFNAHLWRDGSKSHADTKDIIRASNLGKSHALVYLFPAAYRTSFNHNLVCPIEGSQGTSLAALGKLLRTVKL